MNTENFDKYRAAGWRKVPVTVDEPSVNRLGYTRSESAIILGLTACVSALLWFVFPLVFVLGVCSVFPFAKMVRKWRKSKRRGAFLHSLWLRGIALWLERSFVPRFLFLSGSQKHYVP